MNCICCEKGKDKTVLVTANFWSRSGSLFVTENFWSRSDSLRNLRGGIWTILAYLRTLISACWHLGNFFFRPGPPLSQGLDDRPPLSEGLMTFDIANLNCSCWTVELVFLSIAANRHFLLWFCGLQLQRLHLNSCYNSYIAIKNDCTIQISLELVLLADYVRQAISVVGISAVPSSRILSSRKRRLDGFSRLVDSDVPFGSM